MSVPQIDSDPTLTLARGWLLLGVAALAASGLYSVLIVLLRTPGLHDLVPGADFFRTALVVHVDLSVVIWFMALGGVLWSLRDTPRFGVWGRIALWLSAAGTALIALAPFFGAANPLLNNYIPVLRQPAFFAGLALLATGFVLLLARALLAVRPLPGRFDDEVAENVGLWSAAVLGALAMFAFAWSFAAIGDRLQGHDYFEVAFWGGGHVLQFTHTLLMLVAWAMLARACGTQITAPAMMAALLLLAALPALGALPIYFLKPVLSSEHRSWFTVFMKYGHLGMVPLTVLCALAILRIRAARQDATRHLAAALIVSWLLFAAGGVLGFLIQGVNVVIPAHYHGSIVGVTLAFMGLTYLLLPRFGYAQPDIRLASWQSWIYGGGQLLHILGLAWSGGYGVARKTAGAEQMLDKLPKIAGMALMGLGGLIAIIGGLLFVVIVLRAIFARRA